MTRRHCEACGWYTDGKPWGHDCPKYRREPDLAAERTDTSFIAQARNSQDGLERYHQWMRSNEIPSSHSPTAQPSRLGSDGTA